jgi:cobalt-zinc-cadmium efflux system membrane fusion protein
MSRRSHFGSALALACTIACGGGGGTTTDSTAQPAEASIRHVITLDDEVRARVTFTTTEVVRLATDAPIAAIGELGVDEHRYAIVDAPAEGRVVALLAHVGERVGAGDPLVELASGGVGELRAHVTEAEANVHTLETRLSRRTALSTQQLGTASDLEDAERELAAARAELERSRAGLAAANARGSSRSTLLVRSPIEGTVLEHHAFPGESAGRDSALIQVADLRTLWLLVHVSEGDAARVSVGDVARVTFPSLGDAAIEIPVALVAPRVEDTTRSVEIRCDVPNDDEHLRPGMTASVVLAPRADGETLVVPTGAVQHTSVGWAVFVPRGDREMEVRRVARGRDLGGEVEILDGVTAGEHVVLQGAFVLRALAEAGQWTAEG